jgi:hypothetical protein
MKLLNIWQGFRFAAMNPWLHAGAFIAGISIINATTTESYRTIIILDGIETNLTIMDVYYLAVFGHLTMALLAILRIMLLNRGNETKRNYEIALFELNHAKKKAEKAKALIASGGETGLEEKLLEKEEANDEAEMAADNLACEKLAAIDTTEYLIYADLVDVLTSYGYLCYNIWLSFILSGEQICSYYYN